MDNPIINRIFHEQSQSHETRRQLYLDIESSIGRPVVSYFTSFNFPVSIEDFDANMLESILEPIETVKYEMRY